MTPGGRNARTPVGLILAAGRGTRLRPFTSSIPKCLVVVGRHPIVAYQVSSFIAHGIFEIIVVIGYRAAQVRRYLEREFPTVRFQFVENQEFASTNTLVSTHLALGAVTSDILQVNGDILYHPDILGVLMQERERRHLAACIGVQRRLCGKEEVKVAIGRAGHVTAITKLIEPDAAIGEAIGVNWFSNEFLNSFMTAATELLATGRRDYYYEAAIERVIEHEPGTVGIADLTDLAAIEIDFPEDLAYAETAVYPRIAAAYAMLPIPRRRLT